MGMGARAWGYSPGPIELPISFSVASSCYLDIGQHPTIQMSLNKVESTLKATFCHNIGLQCAVVSLTIVRDVVEGHG